MSDKRHRQATISRSLQVIGSGSVIIILAGLLAFRLFAYGPGLASREAPAGTVPDPKPIDIRQFNLPEWQHRDAGDWSISFRTDLDLLAPLGTGTANAATWFRDFAKASGVRRDESGEAMDQRVEHPLLKSVLPGDHPLLLEAEPWCDQAEMRFYPEIFPIKGWDTEVPNLLLCISFAKAWVARGLEGDDPDAALEDCRRAVRLGRLLRQDDVTIIADLVGLACIDIGADGIYRLARERGDAELALAAAVVRGEVAPQRLRTSERITRYEISPYMRRSTSGEITLDLPGDRFERLVAALASEPDRRFLGEGLTSLSVIRFLGNEAQQQRAGELFDELSGSDDPFISAMARWGNSSPPDPELLAEFLEQPE
jgi:hypothetical protein